MPSLASLGALERSRTLVAQDGAIWIWPGILLTLKRGGGGEIVPVSDEVMRFWITRLHGPEALYKDIPSAMFRAASLLTQGNAAKAQDALDRLGLFALSRDGASLMKAVASELGINALPFQVHNVPRTWDARDIAQHVVFFKEALLASRPLAKGAIPVFDPAKHPRWPAGAPDSQGGRFAPGDEAGTTRLQPISDDEPIKPLGAAEVPLEGENPLDPKGLNVFPSPEELKAIADTLNIIENGSVDEVAALGPHLYENWPHHITGAILPPSVGGYTSYTVPSGARGRGNSRLIIDNVSGFVYYTNTHYRSFYRAAPLVPNK